MALRAGRPARGRTIRTVHPGILASSSEEFEGSSLRGEGLVGYDAPRGEFFSVSVHDVPGAYGILVGELDPEERAITYEPMRLEPGQNPYRVVFRERSVARFERAR
jgi:hypothetical protein